MSKKKFLDGLESVFGHASDDDLSEDSPLLVSEKPKGRSKAKVTRKRRKSSSSNKNFTSDLDSLFEGVLQESMQEKAHKMTKGLDSRTLSTKRRNRKPISGLDALIRNTTGIENLEEELKASIRRVSFAFDARKYKKLKSIAKEEKTYIKDVLNNIITEFLKSYEHQKKSN